MEATSPIVIRKAKKCDVESAVKLIMLSAHNLLTNIFGKGDDKVAAAFLHHAWLNEGGQYGCNAHWVATIHDNPVGSITAWQANMPLSFTQQTLMSLNSFFGVEDAALVCERSTIITQNIATPRIGELIFGHLAVLPEHQRKGAGKALMDFVESRAKEVDCQICSLDVEPSNQQAKMFYQKRGYQVSNEQGNSEFAFLRMTKRLVE